MPYNCGYCSYCNGCYRHIEGCLDLIKKKIKKMETIKLFLSKKEIGAIVIFIIIVCSIFVIIIDDYETSKINWTFDIPEIDNYTHADVWVGSSALQVRGLFSIIEYNELPYSVTGRATPNSLVYVHVNYYTKTDWSGSNIQGFYDLAHIETYKIKIIG